MSNKKKRILIRADGGCEIGMGHIMRTLVLAKKLAKKHTVVFGCKIDSELERCDINLNQIESRKYLRGIIKIKSEGFEVGLIREKYFFEDLKKMEAEILITDSYDVDQKYFDETRKVFLKTVYIDDINSYYFDVDLLINQNINGEDFEYRVSDYTRSLIGPKYTMIREEFKVIHSKIIKKKVKDIMITVGGSDPNNFTEKILQWVTDLEYNFHLVIGPSFEKRNYETYQNDRVKIHYKPNMCELMQKCDLAISACGSTLYELAICGVPTLGLIIADNQEGIAEKLDELKVIRNLGWMNNICKEKIVTNIQEIALDADIRRMMSEKGQKIVDGKGAERIVNEINKI